MRKSFSIAFPFVLLLICSAQGVWAQKAKVWDLGVYPGGSWAALNGVNDFGVAVSVGDVAGDQRMISVPLFGHNAGNWFESGVSSNGSVVQVLSPTISNTGLIAGTIVGATPCVLERYHRFMAFQAIIGRTLAALSSLQKNRMAAAKKSIPKCAAGTSPSERR